MLFAGKKGGKAVRQAEEASLYPLLHVSESLKEYQKLLVSQEVTSLWELRQVGASFSGVLEKADHFQLKLENLEGSFTNINETSEQFLQVKSAIAGSVEAARGEMAALAQISAEVQQSFDAMRGTFGQLQSAINAIQKCMGKIVSIADETNILAINASIEAARAGAAGRGFSVVAEQVKRLAEEIKVLTGEVDAGVRDVESSAGQLSDRIDLSQQTLGQGVGIVEETNEGFRKITEAADGAVAVQEEISGVIVTSQQELQNIRLFFSQIKEQYQDVVKHIDSASRLGTTKSAMFEDLDNMISQIAPLIRDYESHGS